MTIRCGGNTSSAQVGFSQFQFIGPGAIGAALNNIPTWAAIPIAAALGSLTYDLSTFCTTDPPAMPTFTLPDIAALLAPIPTPARQTAAGKIADMLGNYFWPQLCKCNAGVDTPPTFPTAPAGSPTAQVLAVGLPGSPCQTNSLLDYAQPPMFTHTNQGWPAPKLAPVNAVRVTLSGRPGTPPGFAVQWMLRFENQALSTTQSTQFVTVNVTDTKVIDLPWNPASDILYLESQSFAGSGTELVSWTEDYYCNGTIPGASGTPCCPPDLTTQSQIQAILDLVTLIQRQAVPFGYIASTVHSGLTGAGSLAIADLIGVKVAVTTDSAHLGVAGTSPAELFDRGWITFATADGALHSVRLEHTTQLVLPCNAGVYTLLYYDLNPLITISVTELVRET